MYVDIFELNLKFMFIFVGINILKHVESLHDLNENLWKRKRLITLQRLFMRLKLKEK